MKRASTLTFSDMKTTPVGVRFFYTIDGKKYSFFHSLNWKKVKLQKEDAELISTHIGLSFLIDISLTCLPKNVVIETVKLPAPALSFWKKVYSRMAMERLYVEQLPLSVLQSTWKSGNKAKRNLRPIKAKRSEGILLAMSGGKESLTALKIFEEMKLKPTLFFLQYPLSAIEPTGFWRKKVQKELTKKYEGIRHRSDITNTLPIRRRFKCTHVDGFDMGEIIFGSLLYADRYSSIVIGNELSVNFGNCLYGGREVNHQYVKSMDLAKDINHYIHTYLHKDFTYFSPFFGYYEYPIAKMFTVNRRYFDVWNSCNRGTTEKKFCCECPKCAFTYMMLLAFTSKKFLEAYFWKDPTLDLPLTKPLFEYNDSPKPLECVGEKKEVWFALEKIYKEKKDQSSPTMNYFLSDVYPKVRSRMKKIGKELMEEHTDFFYVPAPLRASLQKACRRMLHSSL